jgi:cbb3-type cytochrome oxidase subunit 3
MFMLDGGGSEDGLETTKFALAIGLTLGFLVLFLCIGGYFCYRQKNKGTVPQDKYIMKVE